MSQSLDKRIEELGNQFDGSFIALVTQLQHNIDRNLSWFEENITVNLTDQYQTELRKMNDTYHLIFQHQQDMLDKVK